MKDRQKTLTMKQEDFCNKYIDTEGNASEAYRMVYDCSKMQPSTVHYCAWELLNNPKITLRINELREERRKGSEDMRKDVMKGLMDIIEADPSELYYKDPSTGQPKLKEPSQLSRKIRNAIKTIRGKGDNISYELHNKIEAARLLGAWNGWDAPKVVDLNNKNNFTLGEIRIGFDDED